MLVRVVLASLLCFIVLAAPSARTPTRDTAFFMCVLSICFRAKHTRPTTWVFKNSFDVSSAKAKKVDDEELGFVGEVTGLLAFFGDRGVVLSGGMCPKALHDRQVMRMACRRISRQEMQQESATHCSCIIFESLKASRRMCSKQFWIKGPALGYGPLCFLLYVDHCIGNSFLLRFKLADGASPDPFCRPPEVGTRCCHSGCGCGGQLLERTSLRYGKQVLRYPQLGSCFWTCFPP